jgi:tRNA(fMet)-specific endonuclease VapC
MLWILDTDHLTLIGNQVPKVLANLTSKSPNQRAITVISLEEQIRGRLSAIQKAIKENDILKIDRNYRKLRLTVTALAQYQILDFTELAQLEYQRLRQQKVKIGSQDLRIAAIALSVGATVVTRNHRDFSQVPGLPVEDWSV